MFDDVQVISEPDGAIFVTFVLLGGAANQSMRIENKEEGKRFIETFSRTEEFIRRALDLVTEAVEEME